MYIIKVGKKLFIHNPADPNNDVPICSFEEGREIIYKHQDVKLGDYHETVVDIDGDYIRESLNTNKYLTSFENTHGEDYREYRASYNKHKFTAEQFLDYKRATNTLYRQENKTSSVEKSDNEE